MIANLVFTSVAAVLGIMLFFSFVVAPVGFKSLNEKSYRNFIRKIFPYYYSINLIILSLVSIAIYISHGMNLTLYLILFWLSKLNTKLPSKVVNIKYPPGFKTLKTWVKILSLSGIWTNESFEKTISNMQEVIARGGKVLLLTSSDGKVISENIRFQIDLPSSDLSLTPFIFTIPLQLLSYHVALFKKCDIDKPRNLAKSVTVE